LGTLAGIPVNVHVTFGLLLAWVVLSHVIQGHGLLSAASGLLLVVSIFGCVVLHELSHALVARRFGIGTREITLLPIGGVARLERMPERPSQELAVALVGPATSFAIAGVLFLVLWLLGGPVDLERLRLVGGPFLTKLMWINVGLATFNLLPAFPMDGGRVLRAALAMRLGRHRATEWAARVGQGMAVLFAIVGVLSNPMLIVIAVFVWLGAKSEATLVGAKFALSGLPLMQAMITDFRVLSPSDSLGRAVELSLTGFQRDFPVVDREGLVGVLTRASVLKGVAERGVDSPVQAFMNRDFQTAAPSETLDVAFERLQRSDCSVLLVLQEGAPVGLLTADSIGQLLVFAEARRSFAARA
jgi:Zn-dependent protease